MDDEESARDVLSNLITRFCPEVKTLAVCSNVLEAVESIKLLKPDVVFLDIEMPYYAGYEIVSFFDKINFEIIFVTAYDHYAIKAFEVSAVDYLLKPIEIDKLKVAIEKVFLKKELKTNSKNYKALTENLKGNQVSSLIVRKGDAQEVVKIEDIIAIEANEAYSCIYTKHDKFIMSKNLKHFETVLESNSFFFRTHKSWIVNINMMVSFSKSNLEIVLQSNLIAKLSKYRKSEFEQTITK